MLMSAQGIAYPFPFYQCEEESLKLRYFNFLTKSVNGTHTLH